MKRNILFQGNYNFDINVSDFFEKFIGNLHFYGSFSSKFMVFSKKKCVVCIAASWAMVKTDNK